MYAYILPIFCVAAVARGPAAGPDLVLSACAASASSQVFHVHLGTLANASLSVVSSEPTEAMCIDIKDFNTDPGAEV